MREFSTQLALHFGKDIGVGIQTHEAAVGIAPFSAVHAGNHKAGQGEQGFDIAHGAPADDGQRATAGRMQGGQCFAQRRRDMHGIGLWCDVDKRTVKVQQEGCAGNVHLGQRRSTWQMGGSIVLGQTGSCECA